MQDLIGVKIDHAAKIDFQGFMAMTDAVGGSRSMPRRPATRHLPVHVGYNDLNGAQAPRLRPASATRSKGATSVAGDAKWPSSRPSWSDAHPGVLLNPGETDEVP